MSFNLSHVRLPNKNSRVWKQECALSFHNQDSPGGLLIDMYSWVAFSPENAKINFQKTNHSLYLNIIKTHKLKPPEPKENDKPKVLGIGVEGGFSVEDDKWVPIFEHNIVILPDFVTIPLDNSSIPELVKNVADAILKADSAEKKEEVKQWVADSGLFVSQFSEHLVQLNTGRDLSKAKIACDDCGGDASTNLWLNLTDGHVGCGRKNFDGSGGQGHALEHFKKTNYPLVVKLGTITAEGADVHSYPEDSLVIDKLLEKHLAHWGLDMKSLQKTDKTVAELEIELQHTYDWSRAQENSAKLVPVYGPGFTGIENLGNTCYMASILQVISTIPEFLDRFYNQHKSIINSANFSELPRDFHVQLAKLFDGLLSGQFSKPPPEPEAEPTEYKKTPVVRPFMLKTLIGEGHPEFSSNRQQDSLEFFQYFLELVERRERALGQQEDASNVFKFALQERLMCSSSQCVKYTVSPKQNSLFLGVPLEKAINKTEVENYRNAENLKTDEQKKEEQKKNTAPTPVYPKVSLIDCFASWAQEEMIEDWFSPATKSKTIALKQKRFDEFPKYLAIQVGRFVQEGLRLAKLDVDLIVPDNLDLEHLRGKGKQTNEKDFPAEEEKAPTLNEEVISVLTSMGFSRTRSEHAAFNNAGKDAQTAMEWLFTRMDDPELDKPLQLKKSSSDSKSSVSEEAVEQLMGMGFDKKRCVVALQKTDNNFERALDYLFSHQDEPLEDEAPKKEAPKNLAPGNYRLFAFVTHMGKSTESGHYVAHIKKHDKWYIFNDLKVAESQTPPREMAYLYFYERV